MHRVRDGARGATWLVTRSGRRAVAARRDADGAEQELARSERRLGLDRVGLASAVLADAIGTEPSYRLASDLSLFLVPPDAHGRRTMSTKELQAWLDTWKPPFETLFPIAERRRRRRG
jgi:hypothetical protein